MDRFLLVQPYGRDRARQATIVSIHETVEAAYAELDRLAAQLGRHGLPGDVVELLVTDDERHVVPRPGLQ